MMTIMMMMLSLPILIILNIIPWKVCKDTDQGDWNNIVGGLPRVGRPSQRVADAKKSKMMMMMITTTMMIMMIMIMIMLMMMTNLSIEMARVVRMLPVMPV